MFAPSVESADLTYSILTLTGSRVVLRVTSATYTGNTLFERELTAAEKTDGNHTIQWDGGASAGTLAGGFATPIFSPYTVTLAADGGPTDSRPLRIEIHSIDATTTVQPANTALPANNRLMMNQPSNTVDTTAEVKVRRKDGTGAVTRCAMDVVFSFQTPSGANATQAATFTPPAGSPLGKAGPPLAVFFRGATGFPASSADSFQQTAKAPVITATGANLAKARITFLSAAAGGDAYVLRATVFAADNTTELAHRNTPRFDIWRRVDFTAYEMTGQPHITTHGTDAIMAGFYGNATFVECHRGTVTTLSAAVSVRYIGLWDHATNAMLNWTTHQAKLAAETPTAAETTDANGPAGPAQIAARAAIQAKANAWRDRLIAAYRAGLASWAPDATVPVDTLVAVEFEHPKYSVNAPAADSTTAQWTAFPWLTIIVEGSAVPPDARWVNGLGVTTARRAYIMAGDSAASTRVTVAHEAAHQSKSQFPRADFGGGDHSSAAGLMDPTGSLNAFTAREIDILKGRL